MFTANLSGLDVTSVLISSENSVSISTKLDQLLQMVTLELGKKSFITYFHSNSTKVDDLQFPRHEDSFRSAGLYFCYLQYQIE